MITRARASFAAIAAVLLAVPFIPVEVEGQEGGRARVLITPFQPTDGTDPAFGLQVAREIRDLLDLNTHVALGTSESSDYAREYGSRLRDLDCILGFQLIGELGVPLVICGEYETVGDEIAYTATFMTAEGDEFPVQPGTVSSGETGAVARAVLASFEATRDQLRAIQFCGMEYNSRNYQEALRYCTQAVELAPDQYDARYVLARTKMELEDYEGSLEQFRVLLEANPDDDRVLENAGWVATQLQETDLARDYYSRYLEINPDNVSVRLRVAHDLAEAGDAYGAMELLEEGIEQEPGNVDLHERFGSYAFRAAVERQDTVPAAQDSERPSLSPEVAELYRRAINSLEVVLEERGSESRPQYVINSMRAYLQIGDVDEAIDLGRRGTEWFPEEARIRSQLADAYNRAGNVAEAVAQLEAGLAIDPNLSNARARMANYYLSDGNIEGAIEAVHAAAEAGEQTPDALGGILLSHGWSQGVQQENFAMGIRLFEAVKQLDGISDEFRSQTEYFHGYALMQNAIRLQEPQTAESARQTLPMFQQARQHLQAGSLYAQQNPGANLNQLIEATEAYIEIQEAVIRRAERSG